MFKTGVLLFPTIFSVTNMKKANLPQPVILKANGDHAAAPRYVKRQRKCVLWQVKGQTKDILKCFLATPTLKTGF